MKIAGAILFFFALFGLRAGEESPVFEGKFRITQDLTVIPSKTSDAIRAVFSHNKDRCHQR